MYAAWVIWRNIALLLQTLWAGTASYVTEVLPPRGIVRKGCSTEEVSQTFAPGVWCA